MFFNGVGDIPAAYRTPLMQKADASGVADHKGADNVHRERAHEAIISKKLGLNVVGVEQVETSIQELEKKGQLEKSEEEMLQKLKAARGFLGNLVELRETGKELPDGQMLSLKA